MMVLREDYDGAEPAANHVAAVNLLKLAALRDRREWALRAESILRAGARAAEAQPFALPVYWEALDLWERGVMRIELRGEPDPDLARRVRGAWWPRAVLAAAEGMGEVVVCEEGVCRPGVRTVEEWESSKR